MWFFSIYAEAFASSLLTTSSSCPLCRRVLRNRGYLESIHSCWILESSNLRQPTINNVLDARYSHRSFGNIGGQNYLPLPSKSLKSSELLPRWQICIQRTNDKRLMLSFFLIYFKHHILLFFTSFKQRLINWAQFLFENLMHLLYFFLSSQKYENITFSLKEENLYYASDDSRKIVLLCFKCMVYFNGERTSFYLHNAFFVDRFKVAEVLLEFGYLQSCAHYYDL